MAVTISTPSWREDQPWSVEQSLANSLATRPTNLASTLLTDYGMERRANQGEYHDYMRAINALQAQNMADARAEAGGKLSVSMVENAGKYQGAGDAFRNNPVTAPFYQGDTSALDQGAIDSAAGKQIHDVGIGMQGAAASGADQQSMAGLAANSPYTRGMTFLKPAIVQAAQLNADSRRDAAGINAGTRGMPTFTSEVEPATAGDPRIGISIRPLPGETSQQTIDRMKSLRPTAVPGANAAKQVGSQLPMAKTDTPVRNVPPELQGAIPGTEPAQTSGPTPQQAQTMAVHVVGQWSQGDATRKQMAREVYKFSVDNGKGGTPILSPELVNGRPAVMGKGGTPYPLQ